MAVHINVTWKSSHEITAPAGTTDEEFRQRLADGDDAAWDHAMDQTDSSTSEPTDWDVA